MRMLHPGSCVPLVFVVLLAACAPAEVPTPAVEQRAAQAPTQPKRIVAAISGDAPTLYARVLRGARGVPGVDALEQLAGAGTVVQDNQGELHPELAEAVPTLENRLWSVLPDGRMEITYSIRQGARWHDGQPITADDLAFTIAVSRDPELPTFGSAELRFLESVEVRDPRTLVAHWQQPFINADTLFTVDLALPLPKHVLERAYLQEKENFLALPHWNERFVGSGPFRLREFERSSHVILEAFDHYVLGRPRVDVLEVRFIPDSNALMANILAGEVELTLGDTLKIEQALQLREQWRNGTIATDVRSLNRAHSQFINPTPQALLQAQFRRALLHAIDRQQMVDSFQAGLSSVAHSVLPDRPQYREINAQVPRYDYDPRRAVQMIEALGYRRGADGSFLEAGTRMEAEVRGTAGDDEREKLLFAIADSWNRIGITTEPLVVPRQLNQDREYRANRPGFLVMAGWSGVDSISQMHSVGIPTAENRYVGSNNARYSSPELDSLIDRYLSTIPQRERTQVLSQIVRHFAEELPFLPLYYRVEATMIGKRLVNVHPRSSWATQVWNAHQWEVK